MTNVPRFIAAYAGVVVLSWLMVWAIRRYALARGVIDHPNARSSHALPLPRGGGAGVLVAALLGFVGITKGGFDWQLDVALLGVIPTAIVGWLDDHRPMPVLPRLSAHLVTALAILPLASAGQSEGFPLLMSIFWVVATVSAINVVNFMDGIDGIIGLQAAIFGAHLALIDGFQPGGLLGWMLSAAAIGFLAWNWPPARIFLGDVGSGSLAALALVAGILVWRRGASFLAVFLPLLPLFLDATVTILRRARRGERLSQAHRQHLYQRLANQPRWGHRNVTLLFGTAAALGAVPAQVPADKRLGIVLAYTVLIVLGAVMLEGVSPKRSGTLGE